MLKWGIQALDKGLAWGACPPDAAVNPPVREIHPNGDAAADLR